MERRPKIEIVRVPSKERGNFRSLDGVRGNYSHIRVGTFCPDPEVKVVVCDSKPPLEQTRKFKKNLGPVSKLLRRRHHATYLATKSCDNIYSVNRSSNSLDWRVNQATNEQGGEFKNSLQASPTICPWVQVEYSSDSINDGLREDSQESDASFQRELQLNELRKRMAGIPTTSQVTAKIVKDGKEQSSSQIEIQVQQLANDYTNASNS
ncbi:hypothetical protein WN48_01083 [Eufriesea mexicana]|nr:hypothetical protein WN48_01083 [Eufriesea mexicana]